MLISLINWLYIALTTCIVGNFILKRVAKWLDKESDMNYNLADYIIGGFIVLTVYAGFFSIFYKVGLVANIVLLMLCALFIYLDRKAYKACISNKDKNFNAGILYIIAGVIVTVLTLMYTAESTFHYDTGLYHAQAIHWIEEYGVVKGQGLVHFRLAYNSTYFPICALYSFKDITLGQSLHAVSGFLALVVCLYAMYSLSKSFRNKTIFKTTAVSDMLCLAPLLLWITVCMELTSPETDFAVSYIFMWVLIRFTQVIESDNDNNTALAMLSIAAFSLVGYKLTSAIVVLISLIPIVRLIKQKNWKNIAICGGIITVIMLPYLIRNYLISGWLIYPFGGIDIFNVPWKIDASVLEGDASQIKIGSQVGNDGIPEGVSLLQLGWLHTWWNEQYYATKMFYSSVILSLPVCAVIIAQKLIGGLVKVITHKDTDSDNTAKVRACFVYIMFVLLLCLAFWFYKAPAIRYGYSHIFTLPLIVCGYVLYCFSDKNVFVRLLSGIVAVVVLLPNIRSIEPLIQYDYEESRGRFSFTDYLIKQVDYPVVEAYAVDWNGKTVYYPIEGDQLWYYAFVSSPYIGSFDEIEWVGDDISDGFIHRNN